MFTKGTWSTMIAGATVLAAATAAMAGVLAPSNASQSVVLRTNGVSTGCGGTSLDAAIDTQIRHERDYWTITYDGTTVRLRDALGVHYLVRFPAHPNQRFAVEKLLLEREEA